MRTYRDPHREGEAYSISQLNRGELSTARGSGYWLCHHDMVQALGPLIKAQGREVLNNPYHLWFRATLAEKKNLSKARREAENQLSEMNDLAKVFVVFIDGNHWKCLSKTKTSAWLEYNPPGDGMCGDHVAKHVYSEVRGTLKKAVDLPLFTYRGEFSLRDDQQLEEDIMQPYAVSTHSRPDQLRLETIKICTGLSIQEQNRLQNPQQAQSRTRSPSSAGLFGGDHRRNITSTKRRQIIKPYEDPSNPQNDYQQEKPANTAQKHPIEEQTLSTVSRLFHETVKVDTNDLEAQLELLLDTNKKTADILQKASSELPRTANDTRIAAVLQLEEIKAYKEFTNSQSKTPVIRDSKAQERKRTQSLNTLFTAKAPKIATVTPIKSTPGHQR